MTPTMTAEEAYKSLTGFDEAAIATAFKVDIVSLAQTDKAMFNRALGFTMLRREGQDDKTARKAVMGMTTAELQALFLEDQEDDAEDPFDLDDDPKAPSPDDRPGSASPTA